jgi:hypothetical protein
MNRALVEAGVVIDLDRVEGRRLDAIAAYAAFVAFADRVHHRKQAASGLIAGSLYVLRPPS